MVIDKYYITFPTCSHPLEADRCFYTPCEPTPGFRCQINTNRFVSGGLRKAVCVRGSLMGHRLIDK